MTSPSLPCLPLSESPAGSAARRLEACDGPAQDVARHDLARNDWPRIPAITLERHNLTAKRSVPFHADCRQHSQRSDVGPITGRRADGKHKSSLAVLHREDNHEGRVPVATAEPEAAPRLPPQKHRNALAGDAVRVHGQPLEEKDLRITSEDRAAGRGMGAAREVGGFGAAESPGNVRTTFRRGCKSRCAETGCAKSLRVRPSKVQQNGTSTHAEGWAAEVFPQNEYESTREDAVHGDRRVVNCPGPARRATAASCSTQGRGQSGSNASSKISSDSWRGCTAAKGRNTKRAGSAVLSRRLPGAPRDLHAERWQTTSNRGQT